MVMLMAAYTDERLDPAVPFLPKPFTAEALRKRCYAVCRFLFKQGFAILDASNHAEALQLWRDHREHISVVVTDVCGVNGLELAQSVQAECPEKPTVFMTATPTALPCAALRKPFAMEDLLAMIRLALGQQ